MNYKSLFQLAGYKPFVEACIDAGQKTEALKYIPKLTDPRERSEVYFVHNLSTKSLYKLCPKQERRASI